MEVLPGVGAPRLRPFTLRLEVHADSPAQIHVPGHWGRPRVFSGSPGDFTARSGVRPTD